MKHLPVVIAFLGSLLLVTAPAVAQQRGSGQNLTRHFDPSTVETVSGVVARIDSVSAPRGPFVGVHLQLETPDTTLPVHLGPAPFLARQSFAPQVGDSLTVRGSRVTMQNAPALIAVEVHHGTQSVQLRDATGRPAWRGQRPRQ